MNELLKVNYNNERPTVSARELHRIVGVKTPFHKWWPRMCEYGFVENVDFSTFGQKSPTDGRPLTDYQLTVDMAKEVAMIQRNEMGKRIRQYLITIEKLWNSPEMVMKRALEFANMRVKELEEKVEQDKPKVLFADSVSTSKTSILIGDLAKLLKQNGVETGQKRLFEWLRQNGYLIKRKGTDHNMPTQRSMEMGLFEVKETTITHSDGRISMRCTTKVTGKGQVYFLNKFLSQDDAV